MLRTLLLVALCASPLWSQKQLLADLKSGDPNRITHAAFAARRDLRKDAIPALHTALRAMVRKRGKETLHARAGILDALIRLGGSAPSADLRKCLRDELLPAVMILAARAPEDHKALLLDVARNRFSNYRQLCWVVACELLASMRTEELTPILVQKLEAKVKITLQSKGSEKAKPVKAYPRTKNQHTHGSLSLGKSPAFGLYVLEPTGEAKLRVVKGVFAKRLLPTKERPGQIILCRNWRPLDSAPYRLAWIAKLLKTSAGKLPLNTNQIQTIEFESTDRYRRDIERAIAESEGAYQALVNRMRIAGLLPKRGKVAGPLKVKIVVHDERAPGGPDLPQLDSVVVWDHNGKRH